MYDVVNYSYLLLPLFFLLFAKNKKAFVPVIIVIYGLICFSFIFSYNDFPKESRKYFQMAYTFFEYGVFTSIFWVTITNTKIKRLILTTSVLFFAFQIFYLFNAKVKGLDSIPIGVETIIMLFYIFYFFYQFSRRLGSEYIYNHFGFWISVGILIYLGGSFFFFILFDHLSKEDLETFGNLTYLAEIIKNVLFAFSMYVYSKHPIESNTRNKEKQIPFLDIS
jgi:hypothetical protein